MSYVRCLRGTASGVAYPFEQAMNLDPADGRPVQMELDLDRLKAELPDQRWYQPRRPDLWRFGALLGLDIHNPIDAASIVPRGEGYTPEWVYPHPLAEQAGWQLWIKDEGEPHPGWGANPTRSFKDRGMAMVVAMARHLKIGALAVPTQGNAGDSLAWYGLEAGLKVAVAMPDDTPAPIQQRVAALASEYPDQIRLHTLPGTIREAGAWAREHWLSQGYFNCATFQEPGWRIEGKKTLGLELAEPRQQPGRSGWSVPDAIIYPTGGGTGVLGMAKAFDELQALGLIGSQRPRMICVQSEQTAPLVRAFQHGRSDSVAAEAGHTQAVGLNVPGGIGHFKVLDIIARTGGAALAVSEAAIDAELASARQQQCPVALCPEGAACLAALPQILDLGLIRRGARVVVVNTGSPAKYR
ncbi:MAG: threonine synthase [Xanthomonadales bacterium]|nr:threonine synthase [Xanthomonadales bacterium]